MVCFYPHSNNNNFEKYSICNFNWHFVINSSFHIGVTCPLPSLLPNGQIYPLGNMYFCGTHVRFRCYPGYNMIGSPSTHCGDDGKWSNPFPSCQCKFINLYKYHSDNSWVMTYSLNLVNNEGPSLCLSAYTQCIHG